MTGKVETETGLPSDSGNAPCGQSRPSDGEADRPRGSVFLKPRPGAKKASGKTSFRNALAIGYSGIEPQGDRRAPEAGGGCPKISPPRKGRPLVRIRDTGMAEGLDMGVAVFPTKP